MQNGRLEQPEFGKFRFHRRYLAAQAQGFRLCAFTFLKVSRLQRSDVSLNARFDLLHAPLELDLGEVAVGRVDAFEFGAVDGYTRV